MSKAFDYTDLIHSVFAPLLEIVERLKLVKRLDDPDPGKAMQYMDIDLLRLWARVGDTVRKIETKNLPPDLRDSLETIKTLDDDAARHCNMYGERALFMAARLGQLTKAVQRGWAAAKQGGTVPPLETMPDGAGAEIPVVAPEPPAGVNEDPPDDLVTRPEVAKLVHLAPDTLRSYKRDWGDPFVKSRGKSPAKWSYSQILPVLKKQFPDRTLPDNWPDSSD